MIDIDRYITELEKSDKIEIVDIIKGESAYEIARMFMEINNINEDCVPSSALVIYKYTPRIHQKLVIKYIIDCTIIGESFSKKNIPHYFKKYM